MSLAKFVAGLPSAWDMAPIYKKGYLITDVAGEPEEACGKRPMQGAWNQSISTAQAAYKLEQFPEVFAACGVYTGPRSGGLVIFDVDWNHGQIVKKWGDDLKGPKVTSPKKNAAKYLFYVPEELWETVGAVSHTQSNQEGWEVLWGAQGLICGEYKTGGVYTPKGDFSDLPEAPAWLIGAMQDAAAGKKEGEEKPKDPRFAQRTLDQKIAIATQCLTVIPNRGRGSRQEWIEIGFMIHDELPNEHGLEIWRKWSQKDEEYSDEWENGEDPCAKAWATFKPGALRFGTLIRWADRLDPKRARFPKGSFSAQAMAELESAISTSRAPAFDEMIKRALEICDTDDIPRMNYGLHGLAKECGYQDQSGIENLLIDHINQTEGGEGYVMTERKAVRREYLIPGLLSRPFTYLFYGREGSGKSATAIALMKHVADAVPFRLRNAEVPVEQGSCIYFSADMSESDWEEEFELHEIKNEHLIRFEPSFNLYKKMSFIKKMKKYKPALIVIDSLSSASGSKAADENKAEFAGPLYWLNSSNGRLWPACSIIVLHHANKTGGARGSTAIGAAVAEVWQITVPDPDDKKSTLTPDQRLITVLKSRMGRTGEQLIQTQNEDFTLSIVEKQKDAERQTRAGSVSDRILARLRVKQDWVARTDLAEDSLIRGGHAAVRKALQRLENRGLVESMEGEVGSRGGKRPRLYRIVGSRGERKEMSQSDQNPSSARAEQWDTTSGAGEVSHCSGEGSELNGTSALREEECPIAKPSGGALSAPNETLGGYIENDWDDPGLTRKLEEADAAERQARLARFIIEDTEEMCAAANQAIEAKEASKPVVIDVDCSNVETD